MIIFEIRPLKDNERKYTYAQSAQIEGQTGNIGILRWDFERDGQGFYTTWKDCQGQYKSQEFKEDLARIINVLQSDEYGLLKNRMSMAGYAERHSDSAFQGKHGIEYGFRIDTAEHAYLIRCNPSPGDYNFYFFCYISKWLDKHLENAERGIRFVGADGKDLFRLPDGEKLIVTTAWGENLEFNCRYVSESHLEVGNEIYHVNEFAERMDRNGASYKPKQARPEPEIPEKQEKRAAEKKIRVNFPKVR